MIELNPQTLEEFITSSKPQSAIPIQISIDRSCTVQKEGNTTTIIFDEEWMLKNIPINIATNFYIGTVKKLESIQKREGGEFITILKPNNNFIKKYMVDDVKKGEFLLLPMEVFIDRGIEYETILIAESELVDNKTISEEVSDIIEEFTPIAEQSTQSLKNLMKSAL